MNDKKSLYNNNFYVDKCTLCGSQDKLEVHHVLPREDAINKRNHDGTALHSVKNLAVLCKECHDKDHSGALSVGPVEDTSEGPRRRLEQYRYNPGCAQFCDEHKPTLTLPIGLSEIEYCVKYGIDPEILSREVKVAKDLRTNPLTPISR